MNRKARSFHLRFSALLIALAAGVAAHAQASGSGAGGGTGRSATAGVTGQAATQGAAATPAGQTAQANAGRGTAQSSGIPDVAAGPQSYVAGSSPVLDPRKPAPASPNALTLLQVLDRARSSNPTLAAGEANLRSVRAQEIQAAVRANPYIGVVSSLITEPATVNNPYTYAFQVSRLFERGNKRGIRIENAKNTTAQTAEQLDDTIRQMTLQIKTAFTHMLFAKQALVLAQAQLADFRHEVDIAHDRYQAGDLGKLDFERLDLQLGSFESDVANDQIALEQSSAQLQTLMGIANPSPTFDITGEIIPPLVTQTREQLITEALQSRPDLRATQTAVSVAQSAYRLAVANGTADPTIEGEYDRSGHENSGGFSVNIPLRIFDRNQGNKETARLSIETARFTQTAAQDQVVSDVIQAWSAYTRAREISNRFGQHYLDESTDVLGIARFAFDHGGLALIDYLDALRDARSTTSDALNAYQQTWLAIHQLSAATAIDVTP
jgi:cobalt-zinc-cadmium efflux system outer membrane protein